MNRAPQQEAGPRLLYKSLMRLFFCPPEKVALVAC